MINKRINLIQLESYVRGHEKKLRTDEYGTNLYIEAPPNKPVGPWNKWEGGLLFDLGEKAAMGDTCVPTARLMAAAPELFAELKRCYEQMDRLHQVADLATDYIGEIHHSHWDIFEERMFAAGLWERPSE